MTSAQKAKSSSTVTYIPSPPPLLPSGKASKYKIPSRRMSDRESNRTVGPPLRVVGSPCILYHPAAVFVNPILRGGALFHLLFVLIHQMNTPIFYIPSCKKQILHLAIAAEIWYNILVVRILYHFFSGNYAAWTSVGII